MAHDGRRTPAPVASFPPNATSSVLSTASSTDRLPDVAGDQAQAARLLDWVGMGNIALPLRIEDAAGGAVTVPVGADVISDPAMALPLVARTMATIPSATPGVKCLRTVTLLPIFGTTASTVGTGFLSEPET